MNYYARFNHLHWSFLCQMIVFVTHSHTWPRAHFSNFYFSSISWFQLVVRFLSSNVVQFRFYEIAYSTVLIVVKFWMMWFILMWFYCDWWYFFLLIFLFRKKIKKTFRPFRHLSRTWRNFWHFWWSHWSALLSTFRVKRLTQNVSYVD